MVTCCQREGIDRQFGRRTAAWELRRYRRNGPAATTRQLIGAIRETLPAAGTVIDVGGGVGAIHHELLDAGLERAVHVDVSLEYLRVAEDEAIRRGHASRVQFIHDDFVEIAASLPPAEVVTLDRVICCYPELERLLEAAMRCTGRLLGAVYPRRAWWTTAGSRAVNAVSALRRSAFRTYIHPPAAIDAILRGGGLQRGYCRRTALWEIALYARPASAVPSRSPATTPAH